MVDKIGQRLRDIRVATQLKSDLVGREIKYAGDLILKVERGSTKPNVEFIGKICKFYQITIDSLVYSDDNEFKVVIKNVKEIFDKLKEGGKYKMKYHEMVKKEGNEELVTAGMFTKEEIRELRNKGYKERTINRHGIQVLQ